MCIGLSQLRFSWVSPVRDILPCSHSRDFGVRDAGCGKDWPLVRPIFLYGECAQARSKSPIYSLNSPLDKETDENLGLNVYVEIDTKGSMRPSRVREGEGRRGVRSYKSEMS